MMRILFGTLLLATAIPAMGQEYTRVVDRNYTPGLQTFAYVGDPVARVKDYWEKKTEFQALRADESIKLTGCLVPGGEWIIPAGVDLPIVGTKVRKGIQYNLVPAPQFPGVVILVDQQGAVPGYTAMQATGFARGCKMNVSPAPPMRQVTGSKIDSARGYTNFELVYLGVAGQTMRFMYREYTPDDMARPAFSQEVTYDRTAGDVAFKKLKLKVDSVDSSKIVYTVTEDGL